VLIGPHPEIEEGPTINDTLGNRDETFNRFFISHH